MKAFQRSQRRNAQPSGPGISLFPFLAVLICTMGALVPLLLVISRTARLQAEAIAMEKLAQQSVEVKTRREDAQWRVEQLKQSRTKTESQLAEARLELGHIEDHSRRLRSQLAQYENTLGELDRLENNDQQKLALSQAELERIRGQVKTAEGQLAKTHQEAAGRSRSYAVIPYEGPNQTHRRPIYIECREDAVVLQPEGITLTESDFEGPLGPGNPLAAALRAAREYMLAQRDFDPQAGEPYPMLLVRPEGIAAYYAARAAMKSWGFDFGYELVNDGWKLAYPPSDPRLAEVIRQVIASARSSQARLIAAAPRQYEKRSKVVYRALPSGGLVRETVPSNEDDYRPALPAGEMRGERGEGSGEREDGGQVAGEQGMGYSREYSSTSNRPLAASQPTGNEQGFPGGGTGVAGAGSNATSDGPALTGNGSGNGYPQSPLGQNGSPSPYAATEDPSSRPLRSYGNNYGSVGVGTGGDGSGGQYQGVADNPYRFAAQRPGTAVPEGDRGGETGDNSSPGLQSGGGLNSGSEGVLGSAAGSATGSCPNAPRTGVSSERPEGYVVGQPPQEQPMRPASDEPPPADAPRGYALRPGEWQPKPEPPPKMPEDKNDKNDDKRDRKTKKNLVERRGVDWALRDAARGSVGVTRPIRVECYPDRLVVISENRLSDNKVIPLGPRTISSIDTFISAVWERMESWGIAGRGMYWRPLLRVDVAPGAEQRFADLSVLLEGSGMMVERK